MAKASKSIKVSTMALAVAFSCTVSMALPADAQQQSNSCSLAGAPTTGLRTPFISGTKYSLPFMQPQAGAPPAPGDGMCPAPVHPGHTGAPTLIPSNAVIPGGLGRDTVYIPYDPNNQSMPGQLGPGMQVPPPPSTLGCDPGMVQTKRDYYYRPPVLETNVMPGGGLAGYAPTQRWGGQTTADFGRYKYRGTRSYDWGQQACGQTSQDGPYQALPYSQATQDLYGMRGYGRNGPTTMTIAPY